VTRARRLLLGLALVPALVACGAGSDPAPAPAPTSAASVATALVPVGSAVVIAGATPYVVAQPAEGKYVAFGAACDGAGTTVAAEDGLVLTCPADGSTFDAATGAVTRGPAAQPLQTVTDTLVVG
jgi:cytochrome b6-f complex iron-sulfur subunit